MYLEAGRFGFRFFAQSLLFRLREKCTKVGIRHIWGIVSRYLPYSCYSESLQFSCEKTERQNEDQSNSGKSFLAVSVVSVSTDGPK